jgi:hypothetical protein
MSSLVSIDYPTTLQMSEEMWRNISWRTLRDTLGDREIPIQVGARRQHTVKRVSLHKYIDQILRGDTQGAYARQLPLEQYFPEFADIPLPAGIPDDRIVIRDIWIGPRSTFNPLHRDNVNPYAIVHNTFCQITGEKYVVLSPPTYDAVLSQYRVSEKMPHHVNIDLERYRYHNDVSIRAIPDEDVCAFTVKGRTVLVIPGGWWHQVRALSDSISVSHLWFAARVGDRIARANLLARGMRIPNNRVQSLCSLELGDVEKFGGMSRVKMVIAGMQPIEVSILRGFFAPTLAGALEEE